MINELQKHVKRIWDFHRLDDALIKVDIIFGLGSIDILTASRCAELYHQDLAPKIVFSGGVAHDDDFLSTVWNATEAEAFRDEAVRLDVPQGDILIENKATNTGENITLTYALLQERNLLPKSMILVQKPYMGKRTYATFKKQWEDDDTEIFVTSPQLDIEEYLFSKSEEEQEKIINIMVGDFERIVKYPAWGFQIEMDVPKDVLESFENLVRAGYNKHLIS